MDFAFEQVFTGAADYETAIRMATTKMATSGVRVIDYASGVHTSLEAATRRNMMGGMGLMVEQITQKNHDDLGCDGWEISAHSGSAPDHEPYQGLQYTDRDYQLLNNSLQRRIGTLNCGHEAFPIILGVNEPQYTKAELGEMRRKNAEGITYQGRHYTLYEATQKQRQIERAQRVQKNCILVADATGDAKRKQTAQIRLNGLQAEYNAFSKAAGLRTQAERANVAGFSWKDANEAVKTFDKYSKIRYHKDGSIVVTDDWKDRGKVTIPKKYLPNAVVETKTVYKNGKVQIDRTIYGEDAMMKTQIHTGDHNRPDQHKYGKSGKHAHDYRWTDDVLQERTNRNLTDLEREQHSDILRKEQKDSD